MPPIRVIFVWVPVLIVLAGCRSSEQRVDDYLASARALYDAGDYVSAELEARNAGQIDPKSADVRYLLALIAERQEKYRDVVGHLTLAVESDPGHLDSHVKLGEIYYFAGVYDTAAELVGKALEIAPDDLRARVLNARLLVARGERKAAIQAIEDTLAIDPTYIDAIVLHVAAYSAVDPDAALKILDDGIERVGRERSMALRQIRLNLLAREKRWDEVEADSRRLIEDFPDEYGFRYGLASLYVNQERTEEAEVVLREALERDRQNVEARMVYLSFLADVRGAEPDDVEAALKEFIDESPDVMGLRMALARYYEANERRSDALEVYQEIGEISPTSEEGLAARNMMANIKINQGQIEEGRAIIDETLADVPDNTDALLTRSLFSYSEKAYDDALADLRVVLRNEPDLEIGLLRLARTHFRNGESVLARDAYRRLLEIQPGHPDASNELAALLVERGNVDEAKMVLRVRLEVDPADAEAANRLVELLLEVGELEAAEQEARRMASTLADGEDARGDIALGRVLQAREKHAEAVDAYLAAIEKDPSVASVPIEGFVRSSIVSNQLDNAIDYLDGHLQKYPEQVAARFFYAILLLNDREYERAAAEIERVIEESQPQPMYFSSLALTYPDDIEMRIRVLERGLDALPDDPMLAIYLAGDYELSGRVDEAISILENVLAADPGMIVAANNLAGLLLDYRTDERSHERALMLAENFAGTQNAALIDTLGWALYRTGNYDAAVAYLEAAVAAAADVPELHYHLGMVYMVLENHAGARQELDQAIQLAQAAGADFTGIEDARVARRQLGDS